jgi:pimeloyl-ACP methyl ester carboxylesterase
MLPEDFPKLTMPKLYVAIENDWTGVTPNVKKMYEYSLEPKDLHVFEGDGHGTDLFNTDKAGTFTEILLEFLESLL